MFVLLLATKLCLLNFSTILIEMYCSTSLCVANCKFIFSCFSVSFFHLFTYVFNSIFQILCLYFSLLFSSVFFWFSSACFSVCLLFVFSLPFLIYFVCFSVCLSFYISSVFPSVFCLCSLCLSFYISSVFPSVTDSMKIEIKGVKTRRTLWTNFALPIGVNGTFNWRSNQEISKIFFFS